MDGLRQMAPMGDRERRYGYESVLAVGLVERKPR